VMPLPLVSIASFRRSSGRLAVTRRAFAIWSC
jgi:hypothetical protein